VPRPDAESTPTSDRRSGATPSSPLDLQEEHLQAQKMEAIGLLAAGVAHELNNPLASILAFSQLIRTDPSLPPELHDQADLLIQEAKRIHRIVNGLLDFARQRPPERVPTSLREVVDEVLALESYTFGPGRIEAIVEIPDDIPAIPLDHVQIEQVLVNLTINAAQAIRTASEHGTIRIVAARALTDDGQDVVRLSITDDGPGIPPELRSHLFVPFQTTKAPGEGTGLGLSVSFGIVAGHGGTLRHEAGPGGVGTTFIIELPVSPDPDPTFETREDEPAAAGSYRPSTGATKVADQARPRVPASSTAADSTAVRILVLDDEAAIRDFLARILRRDGYEPVAAADGASALEIVRLDPPRAILCDHRMAGMSGIAFHEAVAAIDPGLARRFAFMSGDVLNPELHDFAVARGIVLLAKPFDITSVGRTVAQISAS
jgi:CheY-like chemotaxis protein